MTIFIGNNDVLGAFISLTNAGDSTQITPVPQFTADFDKPADSATATACLAHGTPKVAGTFHLHRATRGLELDFFVLFSSFAGALGNVGQADYAAANGFMDQFAVWRGGRTRSIDWPLWDEGGMHVDPVSEERLREATGMAAMQTAITGYNQHIQSVAQARGWAYLDINPPFAQLKAQGQIPVFPDVSGVFIPPPQGPLPITFGPIYSLDGIHPSSTGQRMIADSLASVINQTLAPASQCRFAGR